MKKIIVVGAGASGLMAAVISAKAGASVTILEGMEKPGKKLLTTGNGRCNLTNFNQTRADRYRGDASFAEAVTGQFPVEKTLAFFEELGLLLHDRDGYVYPYVNQASAVLEVLLLEAKRLGITLKCMEKVTGIKRQQDKWQVSTATWHYTADAVILSCGSKAAPVTGSDGSGYALAASMGHTLSEPTEALVPLKLKEKWVKKLSGLRMPASMTLHVSYPNGREEQYRETGELQWTDYGISGIAVFQLSRFAVIGLKKHASVTCDLDLMPEYDMEILLRLLHTRKKDGNGEAFLTGMLPKKAIPEILTLAGIGTKRRAYEFSEADLCKLADTIKKLSVTITGQKGFEAAQVCAGGVNTREVHADTMESKLAEGLFLTGELLDVDGICGGYNLQWAWSSGYLAGVNAAKERSRIE